LLKLATAFKKAGKEPDAKTIKLLEKIEGKAKN